jgi:hypothetical protein
MSHKKISLDGKKDAYEQAISYLRGEECAYDNEGDFREARYWLADKLDKECNRFLNKISKKKKSNNGS